MKNQVLALRALGLSMVGIVCSCPLARCQDAHVVVPNSQMVAPIMQANALAYTQQMTIQKERISVPTNWKLIWQDEFDQPQIDDKKWSQCERGGSDWNKPMSKDARLFEIQDGLLRLRGIVNDDTQKDPSPFLTAGLTSEGKFDFHHGKAEVRARFKSAQGAWPAIWMLGTNMPWPTGGEIDIMEHLNFDDIVYQTIHTPYTQEAKKTKRDNDHTTASINRDEFNTYGIEWDANQISFFVNEKQTFTYERKPEKGPTQWPFSQPMYFILSMQIGGGWVGHPNPAHYPAYMEIDWVRVYKHNEQK